MNISSKKNRRPNVLFIPVDDLRTQLRCYGETQMVTPHIDKLAEQGMLFERAYCQVPVCGASRASLLSGMCPTPTRFRSFKSSVDEDAPGTLTLPEHFRNHGYTALANGKVFHNIEDTAERSWNRPVWLPPTGGDVTWRNYALPEHRRLDILKPGKNGPAFECVDAGDDIYFDGKIADQTLADLNRLAESDNPFFMAAGFIKPHLPFNAPKRYWDYYREGDIQLADNPEMPEHSPEEAWHNWGELRAYCNIPGEGPVPDDTARQLVHGYQAATSYSDEQVGRLLRELDRLGIRGQTIVVLWGDNGWHLGEHGLWCKHTNFDKLMRVPLIIHVPWMKGAQRCSSLVEFIDLYPTLCELTGLPIADHVHGSSLLPVLDDPAAPFKHQVFSRFGDGESIITDQHIYTEWLNETEGWISHMLYDHAIDPGENTSIADLPEQQERVKHFQQELQKHREEV
ncbi:MAG: sulfatase [Kiritimatiellia bacterium]